LNLISAFGQQPKQYVFTHFSTIDGLASNIVNNVVQDDNGFIWLGTIDGLQRYDGNKFITFKSKSSNPSSIPGDRISKVFKDEKGNLWVWAKNKVGIFNTSDFTFKHVSIESDDEQNPFFIKFFTKNENGDATLYILNKGIYTYNEKKGKFVPAGLFKLPPDWEVSDMYHSYPGPYYSFACNNGIAIYNTKTGNINYRNYNKDNIELLNQLKNETKTVGIYQGENDLLFYITWPLGKEGQFINVLNTKTGKKK